MTRTMACKSRRQEKMRNFSLHKNTPVKHVQNFACKFVFGKVKYIAIDDWHLNKCHCKFRAHININIVCVHFHVTMS